MRFAAAVAFTGLILVCRIGTATADEGMSFEFTKTPKNDGDLYLWPINLHVGAVVVGDRTTQVGGPSLGADVARFSYRSLVVDTVSVRLAIRDACGRLGDCGFGSDFFIGPRAFYAAYLGDSGNHRFLFGGGAGWGSVGGGFGGRDSAGSGQAILAPSVAYEFLGLFGLEVAAMLPLNNIGDHYPAAVTVNVLGLGSLLALLAGQ